MPKDQYDSFADVYDQAPHLEITNSFIAEVKRSGHLQSEAIDFGCGTGTSTELLAAHGVSVIGVDRCGKMLRHARRRCRRFERKVRFVTADLNHLPHFARSRVAVACGDVVNHIPPKYLPGVLRSIRRSLAPGAVLMFDAINRFCFERYWTDQTYFFEGSGGDVVFDCSWDARRRRGTARVAAYQKRGASFAKQNSVFTEYLHEDRDMARWLRAAGFVDVQGKAWSPWSDQASQPSLDRTFWTVRTPPENGNGRA